VTNVQQIGAGFLRRRFCRRTQYLDCILMSITCIPVSRDMLQRAMIWIWSVSTCQRQQSVATWVTAVAAPTRCVNYPPWRPTSAVDLSSCGSSSSLCWRTQPTPRSLPGLDAASSSNSSSRKK